MLDIQLYVVVGLSLKSGRHVGLVRELILDTSKDGEWLAHEHSCTAITIDHLKRVLDAILKLLVAAGPDGLADGVAASPVEGVLVVRWLVDNLRPVLSEALGVGMTGPAKIELIGDLDVSGGNDFNFTLLVVLSFDLYKIKFG